MAADGDRYVGRHLDELPERTPDEWATTGSAPLSADAVPASAEDGRTGLDEQRRAATGS
ncbi:hypothetical protein [Streptomyces sp. NBC_00063]|uniref:hypothetical protein n=1 Tax=Streptomyces sp. NBC_00063 TaxID=2975638 RepID=UPI003D74AF2F